MFLGILYVVYLERKGEVRLKLKAEIQPQKFSPTAGPRPPLTNTGFWKPFPNGISAS
jgi:hypothetical protein